MSAGRPTRIRARRKLRVASVAAALLVAAAAHAQPGSDEGLLVDLPILEADEPNRVVIDLAPEGHRPLRLLVDTGAAHSYATPAAARALGIAVRRAKSTPYRRPTRLGRDLQLSIDVSSSDTASSTGWEHAMLGGNFLSHYAIEIDFHAARVRFFGPQRPELPFPDATGRSAGIPMRVVGNRPVVEIEAGAARIPVLLDTGSQGTLILSGRAAREAGAVVEGAALPDAAGVRGPLRLEPARLARLRIGPFEERNVPILVAPHGLHNQGAGTDSALGVEFLRRFVLRLDYPRRRLWLWEPAGAERPGDARTPPVTAP